MMTILAPRRKSFVQKQLSGIDGVENSEYTLGGLRFLGPCERTAGAVAAAVEEEDSEGPGVADDLNLRSMMRVRKGGE